MPMAAIAPRKISCAKSSRPITISRRPDCADLDGLAGMPVAIRMDGHGGGQGFASHENYICFQEDDGSGCRPRLPHYRDAMREVRRKPSSRLPPCDGFLLN